MTFDFLLITYNRSRELAETIEKLLPLLPQLQRLVIVNNASTDDTLEVLSRYAGQPQIHVHHLTENLGSAGGRNYGIRQCTADIVVGIDDDAEFFTPDPIIEAERRFAADERLGLIAFRIVNYFSKAIVPREFPARLAHADPEEEFHVSYFTGAGWAVRRVAALDAGMFDDYFFIYHEEMDLGFRLINHGWNLLYTPAISVYHKQSPEGRAPMRQTMVRQLRNRLAIGYKYLPSLNRLVMSVLWLVKTGLMARSVLVPLEGLRMFEREKACWRREKLTPAALAYLKANHGRLWY